VGDEIDFAANYCLAHDTGLLGSLGDAT